MSLNQPQPVEEFLHGYFMRRTKLLRDECGPWASLTQQFFAVGYRPYDRQGAIADSETERIISVSSADGLAEVITTVADWRFRYRVAVAGASWRIQSMELQRKGTDWRFIGKTAIDSQIDEVVIAFLTEANGHWRKVAMVITRAAKALKGTVPDGEAGDSIITKRIERLVDDGCLDARGDVSQWRQCHSEVCLPL